MPKADEAAQAAAREREAELTKPAGSLGRLEEIAESPCHGRDSPRRTNRPLPGPWTA